MLTADGLLTALMYRAKAKGTNMIDVIFGYEPILQYASMFDDVTKRTELARQPTGLNPSSLARRNVDTDPTEKIMDEKMTIRIWTPSGIDRPKTHPDNAII